VCVVLALGGVAWGLTGDSLGSGMGWTLAVLLLLVGLGPTVAIVVGVGKADARVRQAP